MNTSKSVAELISRTTAAADALKGKRGAPEARELAERVASAARAHARSLAQGVRARSPAHPARVREQIAVLAAQRWRRGQWGEMVGVAVPAKYYRHPDLAALAAPLALKEQATATGLLPVESCEFDRKGRGTAVNVDLYGYCGGLLLAQVRTSIRRTTHGHLSIRKKYLLTDGLRAVEVPPARIKRAAAQDPALDAPLRALKSVLPPEWAARIDAPPLKLAVPRASMAVAYKVVEQCPDGRRQ